MSYDESYKLYTQARELISSGDLVAAIPLLEKSNGLYPHFKTLELLGECEIKLGNFELAILPLETAIEMNNHVKSKSLLAMAYMNSEEYSKAIDLAKSVLVSEPNNKIAKKVINETNT